MACDYQAICLDNKLRYGTEIDRIGPMLLANRYDDRTHFIFELLQNAEDALARRDDWQGSRAVTFHLTGKTLRVSHFGLPFDEPDVRGICGIAESTKGLTAIGRFGIGFKSVYAFTDRPEVHSGTEDFAIESFVRPVATSEVGHDPDETVIVIPLKDPDESGHDEIAGGLGGLDASALLFLRELEEIHWAVEGGRSGHYLRESKEIKAGVRRVTVIGQEQGQPDFDQEWLVISQAVTAKGGEPAGHVEISFSLARDNDSQRERIQRVERSPLVVFFPTVMETHPRLPCSGSVPDDPEPRQRAAQRHLESTPRRTDRFAPWGSPLLAAGQRSPRHGGATVPAARSGEIREIQHVRGALVRVPVAAFRRRTCGGRLCTARTDEGNP